ncbi:hypothetical protein NQ317_004452 [Molorchus minor]|uniref:Uncharacterized protein n=1 Tax=Molorchus minor TaxID=1323400 RepID=A0ABQ9IY54_9CUCU|nr:hypothetical protein NQ317_004452 [Molorchus minor]
MFPGQNNTQKTSKGSKEAFQFKKAKNRSNGRTTKRTFRSCSDGHFVAAPREIKRQIRKDLRHI